MLNKLLSIFASPERLMRVVRHSEMESSIEEGERIIIDEDGTAMVNIRNQQVQKDFQRHIQALRRA